MVRVNASKAWTKQDYSKFRAMIETEVWLIERFHQDFSSYFIGDFVHWNTRVLPSNVPKSASPDVVRFAWRQSKRTIRRLAPWVLTLTFKVLDAIDKTTKSAIPTAFSLSPELQTKSVELFRLLKSPRNEIVHGKKYSVKSLFSETTPTGKAVFEDYLVVKPRKNQRWLVSLPDLFSIAHLVVEIANLVSVSHPSCKDIKRAYDEYNTLHSIRGFPQITRLRSTRS